MNSKQNSLIHSKKYQLQEILNFKKQWNKHKKLFLYKHHFIYDFWNIHTFKKKQIHINHKTEPMQVFTASCLVKGLKTKYWFFQIKIYI